MMDQQNFEATRPVSADPAVALAEALGQLPKEPVKTPPKARTASPKAKFDTPATVESLAQGHGLKLGDQTGLTIRRIKRGKGYSFIRANGTPIRQVGTIKRLNSMAVPPAYREVRYSADPASHLQAVGIDAAGRLQYRYHADWEKVREHRKAHRLARLVAALPKIRRNVSAHLSGDEPTREFALSAVIELIARTAIRPGNESYARLNGTRGATTLLKSNVTIEDDNAGADLQGQGRQGHAQGMRRGQAGARHRHPAHRAGQAHVPVPRQVRHRARGLDHLGERVPARDRRHQDFAEGFPHPDGLRRGAGIAVADFAGGQRARPKKQVLEAVRAAADELSNTPAICRKSYVHDTIVTAFEDGILERFAATMKGYRTQAKREALLAQVVTAAAA